MFTARNQIDVTTIEAEACEKLGINFQKIPMKGAYVAEKRAFERWKAQNQHWATGIPDYDPQNAQIINREVYRFQTLTVQNDNDNRTTETLLEERPEKIVSEIGDESYLNSEQEELNDEYTEFLKDSNINIDELLDTKNSFAVAKPKGTKQKRVYINGGILNYLSRDLIEIRNEFLATRESLNKSLKGTGKRSRKNLEGIQPILERNEHFNEVLIKSWNKQIEYFAAKKEDFKKHYKPLQAKLLDDFLAEMKSCNYLGEDGKGQLSTEKYETLLVKGLNRTRKIKECLDENGENKRLKDENKKRIQLAKVTEIIRLSSELLINMFLLKRGTIKFEEVQARAEDGKNHKVQVVNPLNHNKLIDVLPIPYYTGRFQHLLPEDKLTNAMYRDLATAERKTYHWKEDIAISVRKRLKASYFKKYGTSICVLNGGIGLSKVLGIRGVNPVNRELTPLVELGIIKFRQTVRNRSNWLDILKEKNPKLYKAAKKYQYSFRSNIELTYFGRHVLIELLKNLNDERNSANTKIGYDSLNRASVQNGVLKNDPKRYNTLLQMIRNTYKKAKPHFLNEAYTKILKPAIQATARCFTAVSSIGFIALGNLNAMQINNLVISNIRKESKEKMPLLKIEYKEGNDIIQKEVQVYRKNSTSDMTKEELDKAYAAFLNPEGGATYEANYSTWQQSTLYKDVQYRKANTPPAPLDELEFATAPSPGRRKVWRTERERQAEIEVKKRLSIIELKGQQKLQELEKKIELERKEKEKMMIEVQKSKTELEQTQKKTENVKSLLDYRIKQMSQSLGRDWDTMQKETLDEAERRVSKTLDNKVGESIKRNTSEINTRFNSMDDKFNSMQNTMQTMQNMMQTMMQTMTKLQEQTQTRTEKQTTNVQQHAWRELDHNRSLRQCLTTDLGKYKNIYKTYYEHQESEKTKG